MKIRYPTNTASKLQIFIKVYSVTFEKKKRKKKFILKSILLHALIYADFKNLHIPRVEISI